MKDLNEMKTILEDCEKRSQSIRDWFDVDSKQTELQKMYGQISSVGFDKDLNRDISYLSKLISKFNQLEVSQATARFFFDEICESPDQDLIAEVFEDVLKFQAELEEFELIALFNEDDKKNAIITINSGAGGTEAQDWAKMVFKMYHKWALKKGFVVEILNLLKNDHDGIKNIDFLVTGKYAYGLLKSETGVHRLVRNSPFDSKNSRHTSFSSVLVTPEIDDNILIELKDSEIEIDTYCAASGSGGQNVNKVETAVRVTHIPSQIVIRCQSERSQHQNIDIALKILRSRLYEMELQNRMAASKELHSTLVSISWANQIRSYFLQPKIIIKDHRTGMESFDSDGVLNGDIDRFIHAFLLKK